MKKMVFVACALMMVVAAGSAMAGINLAWNDCLGSGLGALDKTVACANSGTVGSMYVSFVSPADIPLAAATDCFTDVQAPTSVTTWWLTANVATRWGAALGTTSCVDWFGGAPSGGIAFAPVITQTSPSRLRIETAIVVAQGEEQLLAAATEFNSGQIILKQSAGGATNTECQAGGAIGVVHLEIVQPGLPSVVFETPEVSDCVTFRGGGGQTCPAATPTRKATWGSIKALYR